MTNSRTRIYKYDNVKWLCMLLVVIGHYIDRYTGQVAFLRSLMLFVYSFHMPAFIFISGLFKKPLKKESPFDIRTFLFFILTGYALKLVTALIQLILRGYSHFEFFGGDAIPWFMFVLAAYTLIIWLVRTVHPAAVITVSIILSLACGYLNFIGDFLWISRIIVFFPIYLAGYYLTPEKVINITSKNYIRIPAWILSAAFAVLCFAKVDMIYWLRRLFTGRNPYSAVGDSGCGFPHRIIAYVISAVICIAVIALIPDRKIPFITRGGGNTIGIYFWHNPIRYVLLYTGFFALYDGFMTKEGYWLAELILLVLCLAICVILSLDIFSRPLNALKKWTGSFSTKTCLIITASILAVGIVYSCIMGIG